MKTYYTVDEIRVLGIKCLKKQLESVNKWRLLGVTIDQRLEWKSHSNKITKDLSNIIKLPKQHYRCYKTL